MKKYKNKDKWYYHHKELEGIRNLVNSYNMEKALILIGNYCRKYPKDQSGIILHAVVLNYFNRYEESLDLLNTIDEENSRYKKIKLEKLNTLMALKKYDEAGRIIKEIRLDDNYDVDSNRVLRNIFCVYYKVTMDKDDFEYMYEYEDLSKRYIEKQIINYDIENLYESLNFKNNNEKYNWGFNPDISLEEMVDNVKLSLDEDNKLLSPCFDKYYVPYNNVGFNRDNICNYVLVYTIKDTKDIVLITPVDHQVVIEKKKKEEIDTDNYKKKDMIKRFNDRYSKRKI